MMRFYCVRPNGAHGCIAEDAAGQWWIQAATFHGGSRQDRDTSVSREYAERFAAEARAKRAAGEGTRILCDRMADPEAALGPDPWLPPESPYILARDYVANKTMAT